MRTIKFRGQRLQNGEWAVGSLLQVSQKECYIVVYNDDGYIRYEVDPETIGQFTGLLDKNGKEIFEGDILKVYYYGKSKVFGVVKFDDARFYIDDEFMRNELKVKAPMTELFSHYQFEVIGNIHDNPELIKEK